MEARDADRAFPPPVAATPTFASTPAWVGTKRGSAPGVPTPLTWAAKSEWPGGMMTPRFDGAGVYNTPEGSWLTGPVPFFDPSANANQEKENVARALPLTPMSTGRFKADAATAAASASDENQDAIVSGASNSASVSKPTSKSPVPFRRSPKSISRLSRVLASPARGTERTERAVESADGAKTPKESSAKRSLGETFATKKRLGVSLSPSPDVDVEGAFLDVEDDSDMVSVDMMTPSPSRRSGRLDSPVSQSVHASGKKSASGRPSGSRHAGTPPKTPKDSRGGVRRGAASPAAKMQAHALVSLANLREEMDEKERVWGDALAEAEAELAGAKLEASRARAELAEEKAKTPEKPPGSTSKPGTPPREETPSPSPKSAVQSDVHDDDRVNASENTSSETPKTSVFLQAKTHSLEREVARLTAQLASLEASHARAMDVEARKAKARVDAAKEETAAAFAREKDLWAEVHKLRERADAETTASRDVQLKSLRSELEEERKAHKEASRRAAAAEASRSAAAEDAERFRLESDALAESLAETTKRLESVTHVKEASVREAFETKAVAEKKHRDELAQFEEALAEARAALEASTSAERRAETDAETARADAEARVVTERETNRRLAADLESMKDALEREKKEHKKEKQRLETRLEDAERRVAVAEIDAETREKEKEKARADAADALERSFEARVASVSASAKKSESARAEACLRRAELAEAELERVHAEFAGAEEREKTLAAEKLAAEKLASASSSRAEAAEADAAAARATAEAVRVAAAADREAAAESERALRAQKADAAFQLAEAARDAAEKERRGADLEASVAEAEALAREARAELAAARGDLASARAEAAASAREATAAAKARENADVKAREASASSAASLSELAALKSEHARVVALLASSRAAARGGEDAASRLSAVEATREAIALELETAASKEQALHAKIRNLEVELERARAAAAAARLEKEEAEAERVDVGRKLETALADVKVSRGNRLFRRPSAAGSAPSTPVDARRTRRGSAGRTKRAVPATTGKGRTPARRDARDEILDDEDEDAFASDTTASGSDDADDSDVEASPLGATPAAVAGLVGLARARLGTPSPSRRLSGVARERRESPSAGGRSPSGAARRLAAREAFLKEARRRRFLASASFASAVSVFAFLVAAARGATGSGACAGGLFGVVAAFADEWLSGTVRARFRVQCDGAQMPS